MRFVIASIAAAVIAVIALALSAVALARDGGSDSRPAEMEGQLQQIQTSLAEIQESLASLDEASTRSQVTGAVSYLNGVGFHAIDDELQVASEIPPVLSGQITRARQVAEGTRWPDEVKAEADALIAALREFEEALSHDDLQSAKGAAMTAHGEWHHLEGVVYPYLAGEEPAGHGHDDDDDGHGEGDDHGGEDEGEHGG